VLAGLPLLDKLEGAPRVGGWAKVAHGVADQGLGRPRVFPLAVGLIRLKCIYNF
jgi:hypothetical protein